MLIQLNDSTRTITREMGNEVDCINGLDYWEQRTALHAMSMQQLSVLHHITSTGQIHEDMDLHTSIMMEVDRREDAVWV